MAKSAESEVVGLAAEPFAASFVFDNPSLGRALRYTFAEKRLGRAVFMNALILVIALGVVQELFTRFGVGLGSEKLTFGRAAFLAIAVVETALISLLGPIAFANIFNAERREDCFDQVVAAGCSPLRILFGRYAAVLIFLGVVFGSALPFFVFASVVLRGATLGDVALFYGLLTLYASSICAATLATTVALEDAAFPVILGFVFALAGVAAGFSPTTPAAAAAWSPFRHLTVELSPVLRQMGLGELLAPSLYGRVLPVVPVSLGLYFLLLFLSFAYTCVGPDLELSEGLDSFGSVTLKRGGEASRGRRGIAATLLRTVQLRFFYENLGPRIRALGPFLRIASTVTLYVVGHFLVLGMLWPRALPKSWLEIKPRTMDPYLGVSALALGLIALTSCGSRAAVLARVPVLSLGPLKLGRFPALFAILAVGLALPPALVWAVARRTGLDPMAPEAMRFLQVWGIVCLYAVFVFSLGLVCAMATRNPFSSMGTALMVLLISNLLPLGWVPLFTSSVVTEDTARLVDVSPAFAAWAVAEPEDGLTLTQLRDEQTFQYEHKPSWKPFVFTYAPAALILLVIGLVLERRDARGRKFIGALAVFLAALVALAPGEAGAQQDPDPQPPPAKPAEKPPERPAGDGPDLSAVSGAWRVELQIGLGGKASGQGFAQVTASVENGSDRDQRVSIVARDPVTGTTFTRLGPVDLPRGTARRARGIATAEPIAVAPVVVVEVIAEDGTVLAQVNAKADTIRSNHLLVILDRRGAPPFPISSNAMRTHETPARIRSRGQNVQQNGSWAPTYVAEVEDLPVLAAGWTSAGAVVVGDLDLARWEPAQARALAGWLRRGGELILAVGGRAQKLHASPLGQELGKEALELVPDAPPRSGVGLGRVLESLGTLAAPAEPAAAVAALTPGPRDGVLDRDDADVPVACQRRIGAGRLTVLAYDPWQPPVVHRAGAAKLLERALAYGPRWNTRADVLFPELIQLRVQPARIGPAFGALLLYALFMGPGIYFVLRPKRRGLLAWLAIPGFTVVFALLTPLYTFVLERSESAVVTGSIIETVAGDRFEMETADALIFSGGLERHNVSIRGEDVTANIMLPPRGFRGGAPRVGAPLGDPLGRGDSPTLDFPLDVPLWGARYVTSERLARPAQPRLLGEVALRAEGAFIELVNEGLPPLEDAVLVYAEFSKPPKALVHEFETTIDRGGKVSLFASGRALGAQKTGPGQKDLSQTIAARVLNERASRRVETQRDSWDAWLIARVPEAPPVITAAPHVRLRGQAAVLLARVPLRFEDVVPFGVNQVTREVRDVAAMGSNAPVTRSPWFTETRIQFPRGSGARGRAPKVIKLEVVPSTVPLRNLTLSWRDPATNAWKTIPIEGPGVERDFSDRRAVLPVPGEAFDLAREEVVIRQCHDAGGTNPTGFADMDGSAIWRVAIPGGN